MANIVKLIRHNRFNIQAEQGVQLVITTPTGGTKSLDLVNCSLTGLGAISSTSLDQEDGFIDGAILPPAKIKWANHECFLGRLVLRATTLRAPNEYYCGFQTIDSKVPIDGPLSRVIKNADLSEGNIYDFDLNPEKFTLASFQNTDQTNIDLFAKCRQFSILLKKWRDSPKYQYKTVRTPSKGARVSIDHLRKNGRSDFIIMGSNDYLGLASHPAVVESAKKALDQYGFGSTGSPVTTGLTQLHEELTAYIARVFGKEKAILYNSGYGANIGILSALTGEQDLIVADILSHASIHDGMQMSKATKRFFRHNDPDSLAKILEKERQNFGGCLVVTEGVFSMDGDIPPIDKLVNIANTYQARFMIDEAHSWGVVGPAGLGAAAKYNLLNQTDLVMGTFSKICGTIGGFAVGDAQTIEWLYHFSRAHVFSVSLPPSTVAATLTALKIFYEDRSLLDRLHANIKHFVRGLRHLGAPLDANHESSVVPVVIGDEKILGEMNASLRDDGVFVVPVVYPAVPRLGSRFRFTVMATHSLSDLDLVLSVFEKAMIKSKFSFPKESLKEKAA
jgi:8-amino-7-oxononanoate synthase